MRQRKNKYQRKILQMKLGLMLVGVMILVMSGLAVAKYYSLHVQKGVGVASDFYFESDVLQEVSELTEETLQNLTPYAILGQWSGTGAGESSFRFSIKNYKSKFQYNKGVDIRYNLYIKLAEEDNSGITYQIKYDKTTVTFDHTGKQSVTQDNVAVSEEAGQNNSEESCLAFSGMTLKKDQLSKNEFEIIVQPNSVKAYPKDIYIWALPTEPSYINTPIAAKLTFQEGRGEFSVSGGFEMEGLNAENFATAIQGYSGFVYQVVTTGLPEDDNKLVDGKIPVTIRWNANVLKIDLFNRYYLDYLASKNLDKIEAGADGWCTMKFSLEPDSAGKIVFFRSDTFNSSADTYEKFCEMVTCTSSALSLEEES